MKYLLPLLLFTTILISPDFTAAQGVVVCSGVECNACHLIEMINKIINIIISLCAVIAVVVLAIAGFKLLTSGGDTSALEEAKKLFSNVVIGFIIVLAAWLIVDTVMEGLTGKGLEAWGLVDCGGLIAPIEAKLNESNTALEGADAGSANTLSEQQTRAVFGEVGVRINRPVACAEGVSFKDSPVPCTSVAGLKKETLNVIIEMKSECGNACDVVITGGSELGHTGGTEDGTHGGGDKFDLRTTPSVNLFINGARFRTSTLGGRTGRINNDTGVFCVKEDVNKDNEHWDCKRI